MHLSTVVEVLKAVNFARIHGATSTVSRGRIYEQVVGLALHNKFGKIGLNSLKSVGGSGDRGIDIIGRLSEINVMIQCKSTKKKPSGAIWRDLAGIPVHNSEENALLMLVSPSPMTIQSRTEFSSSKSALMHVIVPEISLQTTDTANEADLPKIMASVPNHKAREMLQQFNIYRAFLDS